MDRHKRMDAASQARPSPFGRYVLEKWKEHLSEYLKALVNLLISASSCTTMDSDSLSESTTLALAGMNIFVLFKRKMDLELFATPTFSGALLSLCVVLSTLAPTALPYNSRCDTRWHIPNTIHDGRLHMECRGRCRS